MSRPNARAAKEEPLDDQVKRLLVRCKGQWRALSDDTGISYSWITKFAQGHITNPGYARLVALRDHLVAALA